MSLFKTISLAFDADLPVFFWGPPGIGKSAIVRQVAEQRDWTEADRRFVDVRLSQMEPVDLRGLPALDLAAKKTVWLPPAWLPFEGSDWPDEGVLFLDEASSAAPSVQAAAYQLVLDRQLGEARMKPGWRLALAGNRVSDGGVAFRLAMPLANRMLHLVREAPNLSEWTRWALTQGRIDLLIVGFLQFRPSLLFTFNEALKARESAFATPRSWEMVSRLLAIAPKTERGLLEPLIAGAVGAGVATEFMAWMKMKDKLPNLDALLAGKPTPALEKDKLDKGYACAVALAGRVLEAGEKNREKAQAASQICVSWLEAADTRYTALFVNLVRAKRPMLLSGSIHTGWVEKHRELGWLE
ncbi:MAG: MoxR family ATPase [Candidatus Accumulibacter sp.]|nr:MoxR family ATPase [Accumulibacter sp.]